MNKKVVIVVGFVLFVSSLLPTTIRTIQGIENAHGLVILSGLDKEEFTYNPYSNNGGFVSPAFARWILKNMDYPYKKCPPNKISCSIPLIMWAGRGFETFKHGQENIKKLIKHFVQRGYSVNESYKGLTPLHESVLFKNIEYCKLLLSLGADKELRVNRPETKYHNFTALQFYEFIKSKESSEQGQIGENWCDL